MAKTATERDWVLLTTGFSVIAVHLVALYVAYQDHRAKRNPAAPTSACTAEDLDSSYAAAGRYSCTTSILDRSGTPSSTLPVRYGRDGRRRMTGVSRSAEEGAWDSSFQRGDPRSRAMSSRDVLLAVFSYLERKDVLSCGAVSVVLHQAATDDIIWMDYTKVDTAVVLWRQHVHAGKDRPVDFSPSCFLQAGLGRVMDIVYAHLPRAYVDLYPRLPPTRELPTPRKARKSWYRLRLTIAWILYLQLVNQVMGNGGRKGFRRAAGRARLALEKKSRAAVEVYGAAAFFPEQIFSFVSFLFWGCCSDYWGELVDAPRRSSGGPQEDNEAFAADAEQPPVPVPAWADMLAMLHGYVRLYNGRRFLIRKDNMGFLLEDTACAASGQSSSTDAASSGSENGDEPNAEPSSSSPKRVLRIPCSHRVVAENLESPVPRLKIWPYGRQMSIDGFMSELHVYLRN